MLYIFHVETGTMMTFEMTLALESVLQLKEVIEKTCRIPADKQVLLVSGGECLDPCAKVCSYSAGTDTNPIFLFSKCTFEETKPPSPSIDYGSDSEMKELVDNAMGLPPTYKTVVKRAQIAQQFCELAREHTLICEGLVHDQHLQQQGWAAAVANLEDITVAFKSKSEMFEQSYKQYLETREESLKMLENFSEHLEALTKIPVLDPLVTSGFSLSSSDGKKKSEEREQKTNSRDGSETKENNSEELGAMSLMMWLTKADNHRSLEQVADNAQRGLQQFDEKLLDALNQEVETAIENADKSEMKEIKGLEERLFGLEQLMVETKKIVQEQNDLAQALLQNQTRVGSLNDPSVLPDLCASHCKQLMVMLNNQHKLRDIRRRCSKAKEELSINLYHRLCWVMYVENIIMDVSNKLMIYHENLKRVRKYVEISRQVQRTPEVYIAAVSEVVRRRTFSQAFLSWANDLSCRLLAIYNEEYEKRKDFQSQFEGHFLQSLFPGLDDSPPAFATQPPAPFDVSLPQLTAKDMEQLKSHLPQFPMSLSVTKLSSIAQIFLTKSMTETRETNINDPVEDQLVVAVAEAGVGSKLDKTLLQPSENEEEDKKDSEIEEEKEIEPITEAEELEKVCRSPMKENSKSGQSEVEVLRFHLTEAGKLASETATFLKTELVEMKSQSLNDKESILALVRDIHTRISQLTQRYAEEMEALHKELEEVGKSKETDVQYLKEVVNEKDNLVKSVTEDMERIKKILEKTESEKEELAKSVETSQKACEELKAQLENCIQEKAKALQSVTDEFNIKISEYEEQLKEAEKNTEKIVAQERRKLIHDHNAKIDELNSALLRTELDCQMGKERAINDLMLKLMNEYRQKLEESKKKLKEEAETERVRAVKETTEKLTLEYKTEMENLRSKFRLMSAAGMEKSPSDSSLEKIERIDMIELVNHEAIITELKEMAEVEKEKAVQKALETEREKLKLKLEEELKLGKARMEEEKQVWLGEAVNRALADKNSQIEMLLSRQENLMTECQRHRDTIRLLTDGDHIRSASCPGAGTVDPLLERIEVLEKEKMILANELDKTRFRRMSDSKFSGDMSASVAIVPVTEVNSRDAATSPDLSGRGDSSREKLPKASSLNNGKISINSCRTGDAVLVVWNVEHSNYTILQESSTLYFLHSDCLDTLGLRPGSDGLSRKLYCTAEVVEKEYCHAKKSENRYNVPKGTKFYRVKVRPFSLLKDSMMRSYHRTSDMSSSHRSVDLFKSQTKHSLEGSFAADCTTSTS